MSATIEERIAALEAQAERVAAILIGLARLHMTHLGSPEAVRVQDALYANDETKALEELEGIGRGRWPW